MFSLTVWCAALPWTLPARTSPATAPLTSKLQTVGPKECLHGITQPQLFPRSNTKCINANSIIVHLWAIFWMKFFSKCYFFDRESMLPSTASQIPTVAEAGPRPELGAGIQFRFPKQMAGTELLSLSLWPLTIRSVSTGTWPPEVEPNVKPTWVSHKVKHLWLKF